MAGILFIDDRWKIVSYTGEYYKKTGRKSGNIRSSLFAMGETIVE